MREDRGDGKTERKKDREAERKKDRKTVKTEDACVLLFLCSCVLVFLCLSFEKKERKGRKGEKIEGKDVELICYTLTALVSSLSFIVTVLMSFSTVNIVAFNSPVRGVSWPLFSVQWGQD